MGIETQSEAALAKAVRVTGSQSAFGRLIGRRQSTVHMWLSNNTPLPAELVLLVERETGISKHDLRPDIYPPASATGMPVELGEVSCEQQAVSQQAGA